MIKLEDSKHVPQFPPGADVKVLNAPCRVKQAEGARLTVDLTGKRKWSPKLRETVVTIEKQAYFVRAATDRRLYLVAIDVERDEDGKITEAKLAGSIDNE